MDQLLKYQPIRLFKPKWKPNNIWLQIIERQREKRDDILSKQTCSICFSQWHSIRLVPKLYRVPQWPAMWIVKIKMPSTSPNAFWAKLSIQTITPPSTQFYPAQWNSQMWTSLLSIDKQIYQISNITKQRSHRNTNKHQTNHNSSI